MDANTEQIIASTIEHILTLVWDGVAVQTIAKKLSLTAAHLQTFQFLSSYISNATSNREVRVGMSSETDPITIPIDNFAYGQINKQTIKKIDSPRKATLTSSVNQTRSRRFTAQSFHQQKSPQKINNETNQLITLPQVKDQHEIKDQQQDKFRTIILRNQVESRQMKIVMENRKKQRQQSDIINKKIMKDMKKFTYDYEGKFFGIGNADSTQYKLVKMNKSDAQQKVITKDLKNPEQKSITNDKIKQRDTKNNRQLIKEDKNAPQFDQNRPDSLLDMFEQDNQIAEGIKLVGEKGKEKVIKEKPRRKLSGMKKYRLNEYQTMIKDKKFKDFSRQISKYETNTLDVNMNNQLRNEKNIQAINLKHTINSNSQISLVLNKKKNVQSNILPPIQSSYLKTSKKLGLGLGLKRLGAPETSRSFLKESGFQSSRRSHKSHIKIDHQQLFFENFPSHSKIK